MSKICSRCGAVLDDSAVVCASCGMRCASVQPQQPAQRSVPREYVQEDISQQPAQRPAQRYAAQDAVPQRAASQSAPQRIAPQHGAPQHGAPQKSNKTVIILLSIIAAALIACAVLLTVLLLNKDSDPSSGGSDSTVPSSAATAASEPDATAVPTAAPVSEKNGWVTENGTNHYYVNGVMQKDTVVGTDADGYFYVDADGDRDDGYCNALTVDGVDWNVIEGKATRVEDKWDECLHSALYHVGKCTDSSMSREEKLRAAFEYIKSDDNFLEGVLHDPPYRELDWPVVCANDLFVEGMGDCFSYGAAFAFMGQACGFENCYACNSGGHGWSEIDGKAYDPEWDMHHQEYNHFGVSPEDDCDVAYFTTLTEGVDWMYMNVAEKDPRD